MTGKRNFVVWIFFAAVLLFFSYTYADASAGDAEERIEFFTELNGCFDLFQPHLKDRDSADKILGGVNSLPKFNLAKLRAQVNLIKAILADLADRLENCTVVKEDLEYLNRNFDDMRAANFLFDNGELRGFAKLCLKEKQKQEKTDKKSKRRLRKRNTLESNAWPDLFPDGSDFFSIFSDIDDYHEALLRHKDEKVEIQKACLEKSKKNIHELREVIDLLQQFNENSFQMIMRFKYKEFGN